MSRNDGRAPDQLRSLRITLDPLWYAEGAPLI